jgi:hypothetical protein
MPAIGQSVHVERVVPGCVGFGGGCFWLVQALGPMGARDGMIASCTPPESESVEHVEERYLIRDQGTSTAKP